ncbi:uncharacterized protein LOC125241067 isoform X1 [Leguminivora glycinivorella]|uniref:uncharacterized protein LOC125241067 isoform X1 n=1 Tax=Leguminivora glycinivorella TaxID=1035111 RepID=UPI00200CF4F6|nr:uncharacterized protein LOC125241067 isoform X1 [Leguminivora glycinivorella]
MPTYYFLVFTGTYTLVQALVQFIIALVAIAQHFCVINFLRGYPLLIYIRLLYFHNPSSCGTDINIGETLENVANEAYVYISSMPVVTTRAFIFSCISFGLSVFWVAGSIVLIKGGWRKHHSNHVHWPWVAVSFFVALEDIVGVLCYINDSFHTATLKESLEFINGISSGFGNNNPSTIWASRSLALLHGRFGIFLLINVGLIVFTILDCSRYRTSDTSSEVGGTGNLETSPEASSKVEEGSERSSSGPSQPGAGELPRIPRPGLSQSFRSMKDMLFGRSLSLNSLDNRNKNRVNFLPEESTLDPVHSPRSFENLIAEQQRRLRGTGVDTSGRRGSLQPARSQPHLTSNAQETARGGRSTAGQLPGQMPWAYIAGAPANRMRDQLPPDEDLPPVPLPDYTALQSGRKASVHRAASSLSSLTQKKDYKSSHPGSSGQVDVLY